MHQSTQRSILRNSANNFLKCFQQTMRTLVELTSSPWTDTGDSPASAKKPYTLPLKQYSWVQQEIESLE